MLSASALLGLLLISHHLELVHLLQLGDLEGAMGLTGLHLEVVDLHVPLLERTPCGTSRRRRRSSGRTAASQGQTGLPCSSQRCRGALPFLLGRVWHDHDDFLGFEEVVGEEWWAGGSAVHSPC